MATSSNVEIVAYDEIDVVKVAVATATVLAKGDLVDFTSGTTVLTAHSGDNSLFLGIAMEGSETGEVKEVSVATRAKIKITVVSGSSDAVVGEAFKYSAGANGTAWTVTQATAEGIMWALESISNGSAGLFRINSAALAGGFLFDTCTEG